MWHKRSDLVEVARKSQRRSAAYISM